MEASISLQTQVFLYAVILGLGLGLVYDLFRCALRAFSMGRVARAAFDLLFCFICLLVFLLFMLIFAQAQVRWYIPGGMALGGILYFIALTDMVRGVLLPLIRTLRKGGKTCRRFVLRAFTPPRGN